MDSIKWCLNQRRGIELVEPNDNLQKAYISKAEDSLETLQTSRNKDWKLTAAYYTIYQGIYSILMKIGIKCEIHSCTIEFTKKFLGDYFNLENIELIEIASSARIDAQYYVNRKVPDKNYSLILEKTPEFLVKCKNLTITPSEIKKIRAKILSLSR